ncbi:hypothetical protein [Coleofasciculus sp. G1-WW12-02]
MPQVQATRQALSDRQNHFSRIDKKKLNGKKIKVFSSVYFNKKGDKI